MNRSHPANFRIFKLLLLSAISVAILLTFLFYNRLFNLVRVTIHRDDTVNQDQHSVPSRKDFDYEALSRAIFSLDQTDKRLWAYIRDKHLTEPMSLNAYNFTSKEPFHPNDLSQKIYEMFNEKSGVFVEACANDGEEGSNTLFLEEKGWQGILIECNPITLQKLMSKHRKAWIANVCLSLLDTSETLNSSTNVNSRAVAEMKGIRSQTWLGDPNIPSCPLYSVIKAVGKFQEIDFLNLNIGGSEIPVLKHFPFEEIKIKVILVKVQSYIKDEKAELQKFLESKRYELIRNMGDDHLYALRSLNFKALWVEDI